MATTYDPLTAPTGELIAVPAENLVIDPNVRRTIDRDASFVSSIRQYGILQPPVGWQDDDGLVHITMGQRRTSAALEIGHPVVHVFVKPQRAARADGDAADVDRIVGQLAENDHRTELGTADRAAAYKQLALFGLTEERIARKTNTPKATVATALKIAESKTALSNAEAHSLDLAQAALIAEFDDDAEAQAALEQQAAEDPDQLAHLAQRFREDRLDAEVRARLEARVREVGELATSYPSNLTAIDYLYREGEDGERTFLTEDDLPNLDGVVGWIRKGYSGDADRGHHIIWYLRDPELQGILGGRTRTGAIEETEEEKEAKKAEAKIKRQAKKDFRAATVVRREWIRANLLHRNARLNESHFAWIAGALLNAVGHFSRGYTETAQLAFDLLGHSGGNGSLAGHVAETDSYETGEAHHARRVIRVDRAQRVALAAAIAHTEAAIGNDKWPEFGQDPRAGIYLAQLRDWGYPLAPVERAVVEAMEARIEEDRDREARLLTEEDGE